MSTDLRDALSTAFAESTTTTTETSAAPPPATETTQQPPKVENGTINEQQPRDTTGKFASKEAPAQKATETTTTEGDQTQQQKTTTEQQVKTPLDAAPSSWKPAARELWATIPPEARQEILSREQAFHQGIEQYKQAANFGRSMNAAMRPFEANFAAAGVAPEEAVKSILAADHVLRNGQPMQKLERLFGLMHYYGIPPQAVAQFAQSGRMPQVDPQVAELQRQIEQLKGQQTSVQQQEQERISQEVRQEYEAFKNDPKNEFFEDVKDRMADLLDAGVAQTFEQAYDMACWATPEIRTIMQQRASKVKTPQEKLNASSTVKSEPLVNPGVTVDPTDLRGAIEGAWGAGSR